MDEVEQNLAFDFGEILQYPDSELEDNEPDQLSNSSIELEAVESDQENDDKNFDQTVIFDPISHIN